MRRWWTWIAATLLVALIVHGASVLLLPRLIMGRAMARIGEGGVNTMRHAGRPTAASRGVVRPSPDLLYSTCVFDLADGPVHVHAGGMPDTYWSISLFDDETDNFHVINDRQARNGTVDFTIVAPGQTKAPPGTVVRAPSVRGLVLVRTLIDDDAHLAAIDAARRHAACAPVATGPG
jgi:uncharacterized membrane protein